MGNSAVELGEGGMTCGVIWVEEWRGEVGVRGGRSGAEGRGCVESGCKCGVSWVRFVCWEWKDGGEGKERGTQMGRDGKGWEGKRGREGE